MIEQVRWQVDSNAPEAYERFMVPTLFAPLAQDLLSRAALTRGERVVDVACGTGIVARLAAKKIGPSGKVVGVDLNRSMLEIAAKQKLPSGVNAEWREADANELPLADAACDVAFCQQGLQFFPEKVTALRELRRVLVPGGRVALSVWRSLAHNPYMRVLGDALAEHIGTEAGNGFRAACNLGEADTLREFFLEAGFTDVRISIVVQTMRHPSLITFIPGQLASTPWAGAVAALDDVARSTLVNSIVKALHPHTDDDGLAVPTESHVAMGWKK